MFEDCFGSWRSMSVYPLPLRPQLENFLSLEKGKKSTLFSTVPVHIPLHILIYNLSEAC